MASKPPPVPARDPTLREMRATLNLVFYEIQNHGGHEGGFHKRVYDHMAWLLDAFLFDVDDSADDGGRG